MRTALGHAARRRTALALLCLTASGCASWQPDTQTACNDQQREIVRLQQLLADRDAEIARLRAQQIDQVKELKETTGDAARAEMKLRRIATDADVASHLAEVEVAMEGLRSDSGTPGERQLQAIAQQFLDAASTAFARDKLSAAAEFTAQAEQLIDMLVDNASNTPMQPSAEVPFKNAIALKTTADARLRRRPHLDAEVIVVLKKMTPIVALAYQGSWLRVQTENGNSGWILGKLLAPGERLQSAQ